ncbi:MAG TPA: DUF2330 domain-containing protein [Polyangiaceae bacterium]|nr:DUF2330 domain-containing protein [Polyangiaceae bacterium]HMR75473.1 DUF2330 domain-containing protein [Polyangiaceae bacterium]
MIGVRVLRLWALAAVACAVLTTIQSDAGACGGFFSRSTIEGPRRPSLAYEQTLIVFDEQKQRQHFIREVAFKTSNEAFGFVVPTPTRPDVGAVKPSPFAELRRRFPFQRSFVGTRGKGAGLGFGSGPPPAGGGVTVLEKKTVGSFTAFVLAADDEKALASWLKKHQLVSTPEADVWLAHYVKMKFFYVAMRYNPPKGGAKATGSVSAETMRISFDTPVAYYPYFEPNPPKGVSGTEQRMLELWFASARQAVPVASRMESNVAKWVRPMAEGVQHASARGALESVLGTDAKLLPEGELQVQTFIDQKRSRSGFGDVLFVAKERRALSDEQKQKLGPLLPILDPSLIPGAKP